METRDRWLYAWGLGYTAVGAASLLIPLYALALGGSALIVGLLASTAAFAGVPGALLWGWLAAKTGRRRIFVIIALLATAIVLLVTPLIQNVWILILVNATLWFVVAAAAPVLTLLVVEGTPEPTWDHRIALLNTWQGYGWVAGLAFGAIWLPIATVLIGQPRAQTWFFWVIGLVAASAVPLALRWLPHEATISPTAIDDASPLVERITRGGGRYVRTVPFMTTRMYWGLRALRTQGIQSRFSRPFWVYLGAVAIFSAGFAVFWGPVPAYLGDRFPDEHVFGLFLAANIGSAVFYAPAGRWAARSGTRMLQSQALAARIILFPLVGGIAILKPTAVELAILLAIFAAIGLTWAVIAVTATGIVTRLGDAAKGPALGLYTAVAGLGGGIGSIAGGLIANTAGFLPTFLTAAIAVGLALLVVIFSPNPAT